MKKTQHGVRFVCVTCVCLAACGGGETEPAAIEAGGDDGGGGAPQYTSSVTSGGIAGEGGGGGTGGADPTGGAGGGNGGGAMLNGCTQAMLVDRSGMAEVEIHIGGSGGELDESCLRVSSGTTLTFIVDGATFALHPLVGGMVVNGTGNPDVTSPIQPPDPGSSSVSYVAGAPGDKHGFYCDTHVAAGGMGLISVGP